MQAQPEPYGFMMSQENRFFQTIWNILGAKEVMNIPELKQHALTDGDTYYKVISNENGWQYLLEKMQIFLERKVFSLEVASL